jgi:hypothetical protein
MSFPLLRKIFSSLAVVAALIPCLAQAIGSVPVTIVNPADIAKAQGIHHPFQVGIACPAINHVACHGDLTLGPQRVVFEYVSVSCTVENGRQYVGSVRISTQAGGSNQDHFLTVTDRVGTFSPNGSVFTEVDFGEPVTIYADGGSFLQVYVTANQLTQFDGYPNCSLTFSGEAISGP